MTIQEILSEFDIEGKQFDYFDYASKILFAMMQKKLCRISSRSYGFRIDRRLQK